MKKFAVAVALSLLSGTIFANDIHVANQRATVWTQYDGYVFMRNAPKSSAKKILKLYDGTNVTVISCPGKIVYRPDQGETGKWCKVSAKGKTGYVFSSYLNFS